MGSMLGQRPRLLPRLGRGTEFEFEDIMIQTPEQKPIPRLRTWSDPNTLTRNAGDTTWKKTSVQSKFLHHLKPARDSKPSRRASKAS